MIKMITVAYYTVKLIISPGKRDFIVKFKNDSFPFFPYYLNFHRLFKLKEFSYHWKNSVF